MGSLLIWHLSVRSDIVKCHCPAHVLILDSCFSHGMNWSVRRDHFVMYICFGMDQPIFRIWINVSQDQAGFFLRLTSLLAASEYQVSCWDHLMAVCWIQGLWYMGFCLLYNILAVLYRAGPIGIAEPCLSSCHHFCRLYMWNALKYHCLALFLQHMLWTYAKVYDNVLIVHLWSSLQVRKEEKIVVVYCVANYNLMQRWYGSSCVYTGPLIIRIVLLHFKGNASFFIVDLNPMHNQVHVEERLM